MKPKDIIIAALLILILSSLLNGCSLVEKNSAVNKNPVSAETEKQINTDVENLVKKAEAVQKEVKLVLQAEKVEKQLKIKVSLDNPGKKPVTSVQAWLSYDPNVIQGKEVITTASAFSIPAPYNNTFDNTNGLMMLGRSNSEPVTAESIPVAEAVFDLLKDETVLVNAYDYRDDLSGHTSVNVIMDGKPYNILLAPESPALVVQK